MQFNIITTREHIYNSVCNGSNGSDGHIYSGHHIMVKH